LDSRAETPSPPQPKTKGNVMLTVLKSQFLRRVLAGFSLGAIGMVALNIERVTATPFF